MILESVGPGGLFGEMALIDGSPRSATAVATEPCEIAVVEQPGFLGLIQQSPKFASDGDATHGATHPADE